MIDSKELIDPPRSLSPPDVVSAYCWVRRGRGSQGHISALFMTLDDPLFVVADWHERWIREGVDDARISDFEDSSVEGFLGKLGWEVFDPRHWGGVVYRRPGLELRGKELLVSGKRPLRGRLRLPFSERGGSIDLTQLDDFGARTTSDIDHIRLTRGTKWW